MKNKNEKAREAEKMFMKYLNQHNIAFWYIQQDINTYSNALKKYNIQRPDFLILIPNFGSVLIDVEYKLPLKKYSKFCICDIKTKKYETLQKKFNLQIWYAFSNDNIHYSTWYFIPLTKVIDLRKQFFVNKKKYISAPINSFIQLSSKQKFTKLLAG